MTFSLFLFIFVSFSENLFQCRFPADLFGQGDLFHHELFKWPIVIGGLKSFGFCKQRMTHFEPLSMVVSQPGAGTHYRATRR